MHWERVCIRNAFLRSGFTKTSTKAWTCLWSKHQNDSMMKGLNCLQKVNHFQASWCIGRKDRLARTMQAMYRKHGDEFNFHPQSYILPAERDALHRHIANEAKTQGSGKDLWIKKPCASSCGQGIAVITGAQATSLGKSKKLLVQKYVADPYLIDGNKFDLRLYVVVTGVDPLRVYIFKEGLTRISTSKYSLKNIGDRFAHLTNYSINKKSNSQTTTTRVASSARRRTARRKGKQLRGGRSGSGRGRGSRSPLRRRGAAGGCSLSIRCGCPTTRAS